MKTNPTLRDVAKFAGVSVGTISNYINNPESVKPKNRQIIAEAIRVLQFTPNTIAQRLARGHSNTILLYILSEKEIGSSTWLHQLPLIQAVNDYLENTPYSLHIKIGGVNAEDKACEYINTCISGKLVDGIIILSAWEISKDIIMTFLRYDFPFMLLESENTLTHTNAIYFDNKQMAEKMVDHLYSLGHRKIGFIGVDSSQQHIRSRFTGYMNRIESYGLRVLKDWVMEGDYTIESGYRCVTALLKQPQIPTAILCGNDNMAVGAVTAIREKGYRVPEDISIIGIDNSIVAKACVPQLTTMEMPLNTAGQAAIEALLGKLTAKDGGIEIPPRVFPCRLIERRSTAEPKDSVFLTV